MAYLTQCVRGGSSDKRTGYTLKFWYDAQVVEALKSAVPHTEREWRETTTEWWVSEAYTEQLKKLFSNFEALIFRQEKLL